MAIEQPELGEVLRTLGEQIAPEHSALLIIDVQNDFVHPDGLNGRRSAEGEANSVFPGTGRLWEAYPLVHRALKHLDELLKAAREADVFVAFVRAIYDPKYISPAQRAVTERSGTYGRLCLSDTFGADFYGDIRPDPGRNREVVVTKHRWSGFASTDLNMVLRANGIKTVLVTGTATSACVESTARDALFSDYYVVAVEDCCADLAQERHDWSMKIIQWGYGLVASAEDVQRIWSG